MDAYIAAKNALCRVLEAQPGESLIVICDEPLRDIGYAFAKGGLEMGLWARIVMLEVGDEVRQEIPSHLKEVLISQSPDIFINLFRESSEETPFRILVTKMETRRRNRLGHCPGVTMDMLTEGALSLTLEQYDIMQRFSEKLMHHLRHAKKVHVTSPSGSNFTLSVEGRPFFTDSKIDWQTMKWMNLPVGEVLCGPEEDSMEGVLVCDLAIGGIGPVNKPVTIKAVKGKAVEITGGEPGVIKKVEEALDTDDWSRYVGEFAFGINPAARPTKEFLEAEKVNNTIHVAFGNNTDFPNGRNNAMNHMDFLISKPTVEITMKDGEKFIPIKDGEYVEL